MTSLKQDCLQTAAPSHVKFIPKTKALGESNDYCFINSLGQKLEVNFGVRDLFKTRCGIRKTQNAKRNLTGNGILLLSKPRSRIRGQNMCTSRGFFNVPVVNARNRHD